MIDPIKGEVLVDETNIKENINEWQSKILFMSQKHYLFEDSILANILIGEKSNDYDEKKYEFAIKISNLARFLDSLENKEKQL